MQPVDNKQIKALKNRVKNLEESLVFCVEQLKANNAILEKILSCVSSFQINNDGDSLFNFNTNKQ